MWQNFNFWFANFYLHVGVNFKRKRSSRWAFAKSKHSRLELRQSRLSAIVSRGLDTQGYLSLNERIEADGVRVIDARDLSAAPRPTWHRSYRGLRSRCIKPFSNIRFYEATLMRGLSPRVLKNRIEIKRETEFPRLNFIHILRIVTAITQFCLYFVRIENRQITQYKIWSKISNIKILWNFVYELYDYNLFSWFIFILKTWLLSILSVQNLFKIFKIRSFIIFLFS